MFALDHKNTLSFYSGKNDYILSVGSKYGIENGGLCMIILHFTHCAMEIPIQ